MVDQGRLQAAVLQIAKAFDPDRIILFGSQAHGQADEQSDADLLPDPLHLFLNCEHHVWENRS